LAVLAATGTATAIALGAAATPVHAQQLPADPSRDGSVVREWNAVAMDVLTQSGRPLLTQPFVVAAMHVAMYDAVMAVEDYAEPFATHVAASEDASAEAAAAAAG